MDILKISTYWVILPLSFILIWLLRNVKKLQFGLYYFQQIVLVELEKQWEMSEKMDIDWSGLQHKSYVILDKPPDFSEPYAGQYMRENTHFKEVMRNGVHVIKHAVHVQNMIVIALREDQRAFFP